MKHLFICVFALFSASIAVNAQEEVYDANGRQDPSTIWINKVDDGEEWRDENRWHDPFDIYSGPVLGVIASNLTDYDSDFVFSPYIGGILHAYFNNHFAMSLEFSYTRTGARNAWTKFMTEEQAEQQNVLRGPYSYNIDKFNTIYKLRWYPIRRFDLMAGLMFGVHFNAKCLIDGTESDIKNHIRKRSGHVIGGVGYEINDHIAIEGYYGFPLAKLAKTEKGRQALNNAREHIFLLTVGYRFKLY